VRQLLVKGTPNGNGLRLRQVPRVRSIIDEELELVWLGRKSALEALNHAVTRGNAYLEKSGY
jgi:sn-glycerol 3-phosphate transport system substrate-binding protein